MDRNAHRRLTGKLVRLGAVLIAHGDKVEADLHQYYGVNLLDLSLRKAWVLIENLPSEARLVKEFAPHAEWSTEAHLLAGLIDSVAINTWVLQAVNSDPKKGRGPAKPKPITRPGDKKSAAKQRSASEAGTYVSGDQLMKLMT